MNTKLPIDGRNITRYASTDRGGAVAAAGAEVFVVVRFDPAQCGACGNGKLDMLFGTLAEAEAYIRFKNSGRRHGASWEIKEMLIASYPAENGCC